MASESESSARAWAEGWSAFLEGLRVLDLLLCGWG